MRIEEQPFHCMSCKHEWIGEMLLEAPMEVAVAALQAIRCPQCGAGPRKVAPGRGDVSDPEPLQNGMTDAERRAHWLNLHDSGLSSRCIADKMCGLVPTGNYPHDGDDFGRCERLLILYPEWRGRLGEMRSVNKFWDALVPRWDEIERAWREDLETWKAGRRKGPWVCYPLMREILGPLERAAHA